MQELLLLQQKVENILKRFTALQAEQERLERTLLQQKQQIADQTNKIELLEKELQSASVIQSADGVDHLQKEELKRHLDNVIRELEKNIERL